MRDDQHNRAGIYVHIPFCQSKCGYCDFYSVTDLSAKSPFIQALLQEVEYVSRQLDKIPEFDTLYLGGGTPSLLNDSEMDQLFTRLRDHFSLTADCEITLEANPGILSKDKLQHFRGLGINRLSLGVQSFHNQELQLLERIHSARQAEEGIALARSTGFDNLSIDLIYALPGQKMQSWIDTLNIAVECQPEHISAYNLVFEEGTPFYRARESGQLRVLDEDQELLFYRKTVSMLNEHGYEQYEVSNYARDPLLRSRHNMKYWNHEPYLGFGPSAHSYWDGKRRSNVRSLTLYHRQLQAGQLPIAQEEVIDAGTEQFEKIFLSLRTNQGLNLLQFEKRFHESFEIKYRDQIDDLIRNDLALIEDQYFRLTSKGFCICDEILVRFAPA